MNSAFIKQWLKDNHSIDAMVVYKYGSRVYGTNTEKSDYDYVAITNDDSEGSYTGNNFDITVYSKKAFQEKINNHEISALECLWLDNNIDDMFSFTLDKEMLRDSISAKVSHCWVKGKKKIVVGSVPPKENDKYIGLKSIFHAFRICDYGCQIAEFGKIVEYDRANYIWNAMKHMTNDSWVSISSTYKQLLNTNMTKFRNLCPKSFQ